mmetsp:Transcript_13385/g.34221  ORF Transcript_13385/g.34221 Transcript_13385/m.34221 type:complete len:286 (+) Transcript_13385:1150-2007(+)
MASMMPGMCGPRRNVRGRRIPVGVREAVRVMDRGATSGDRDPRRLAGESAREGGAAPPPQKTSASSVWPVGDHSSDRSDNPHPRRSADPNTSPSSLSSSTPSSSRDGERAPLRTLGCGEMSSPSPSSSSSSRRSSGKGDGVRPESTRRRGLRGIVRPPSPSSSIDIVGSRNGSTAIGVGEMDPSASSEGEPIRSGLSWWRMAEAGLALAASMADGVLSNQAPPLPPPTLLPPQAPTLSRETRYGVARSRGVGNCSCPSLTQNDDAYHRASFGSVSPRAHPRRRQV